MKSELPSGLLLPDILLGGFFFLADFAGRLTGRFSGFSAEDFFSDSPSFFSSNLDLSRLLIFGGGFLDVTVFSPAFVVCALRDIGW